MTEILENVKVLHDHANTDTAATDDDRAMTIPRRFLPKRFFYLIVLFLVFSKDTMHPRSNRNQFSFYPVLLQD